MTMKRAREDETRDMVNCLMLLSKVGQEDSSATKAPEKSRRDRVFTCKTCNREFPSFQALGGHRASHKKPKLMPGGAVDLLQMAQSPPKPKTHECSICGLEFAIGQALGGHMRRHRDAIQADALKAQAAPPQPQPAVPVLKKLNSGKRVSCLNLELNLAPPGQYYDLTKLQLVS